MDMEKIRFGIIGCGMIAQYHVASIRELDNTVIVAVADLSEQLALKFACEFGIPKYYTDYKELIDESDIDAVCICTPSGLHCEQSVYAANAKKHILCEKPIGINKEQLDEIIEAVRINGVTMGCVFQTRYEDDALTVKKAVKEGKFGKLFLAGASLKYYRTKEYYQSSNWKGTMKMDGGGALMNQGIHGIDLLLWIMGEVQSVYARCETFVHNIEAEDTAVACLKFKNGALGVIEATTSVYPGFDTKLSVHGENGTAVFGDRKITEWKFKDGDSKIPIENGQYSISSSPKMEDMKSHLKQVKDFVDAIIMEKPPLIPPEEARAAVDLILAIYESSASGKEVFLR